MMTLKEHGGMIVISREERIANQLDSSLKQALAVDVIKKQKDLSSIAMQQFLMTYRSGGKKGKSLKSILERTEENFRTGPKPNPVLTEYMKMTEAKAQARKMSSVSDLQMINDTGRGHLLDLRLIKLSTGVSIDEFNNLRRLNMQEDEAPQQPLSYEEAYGSSNSDTESEDPTNSPEEIDMAAEAENVRDKILMRRSSVPK